MNMNQIKNEFPEWQKPMRSNCNDLTNNKFGKLLVLYRYYKNNKNGGAQWVCQCDCGKLKVILGASLTRKTRPTTSCGCMTYINASKANKNNLINRRFGSLVVIEDTGKRVNHRVIWKCRCDCGKEVERIGDTLIQGDSVSCGCHNLSIGALKIISILKENNIEYEMEKTYPDLLGKNKMPYRFDFFLPEYNRLIEFDGIQHFQEREIFKDTLEEIKYRDNIKNQYCLANHIPLVRIPYYKINTLTLQDLMKEKYEVE